MIALLAASPLLATAPAAPPPSAATPAPPNAPSLAQLGAERAQYRIGFGPLGALGTLDISFAPPASPGGAVRGTFRGEGSVLGMGHTVKKVDSDIDPATLAPRRWTAVRAHGDEVVTDLADQARAGTVAMVRQRTGKPELRDVLQRATPVLDPLSFLLRLRMSSLHHEQTFEVVDGRGLWRITVSPALVIGSDLGHSWRILGRADPIYWDGSPDEGRSRREFTLWVSPNAYRTPQRLMMPMTIGHVSAELVSLSRTSSNAAPGRPPSPPSVPAAAPPQ